ncbi:lactonase family protein [Aquabacterium sp. OR-4]|uniref:lactonase family protein n=1 Tax=Aquabacterium sp. OR-4 TaxID=2978127 RepID=UPI0028C9D3C8|nr:lactonase family protein [Aquabacterium sp. OR-4]MDT7838996.1 lactonase family protein [Aquabacterium sp. OR-4]
MNLRACSLLLGGLAVGAAALLLPARATAAPASAPPASAASATAPPATAAPATPAQPAAACGANGLVLVGSEGGQLHRLRLDTCSGALTPLGEPLALARPRWITPHPTLPVVYVASDAEGHEGRVAAYALDADGAALAALGSVGSGGAGATHLAVVPGARGLLVANFGAGSASSLALLADGRLGERTATLQATGSGPHRRQASAHAHGVTPDPSGRWALVADLGADRLFVHAIEPASQRLLADEVQPPRHLALAPGSGPRRTLFGADGRSVYLVNELSGQLQVLRWHADSARLSPLQTLPLASPGFSGTPSGSELLLARDGRTLYAGHRGENQLLAWRIDPASGQLSLLQRLPLAGQGPWAADLHPSGRWLLTANLRSHQVQVFAVDAASGSLREAGPPLPLPGAMSLSAVR